jgi:hypothetical protein
MTSLEQRLADLEARVAALEASPPPAYTEVRAEPFRPILQTLVTRGLSNRAIAAELNDRGDFGPQGGLWHSSSIKRLRARLGV